MGKGKGKFIHTHIQNLFFFGYKCMEAITKKKKSNQQKLANLVNIIDDEPETYEEAINSRFNSKWKDAIKSEVNFQIQCIN